MAEKVIKIGMKFEADGKQFIGTTALSRKELDNLNKSSKKAAKSVKNLGGQFGSLQNLVAIGAMAGFIRQMITLTDVNKRMAGQLSLVTSSSEQLADVQGKLLTLANDTRTALEPTVTLYARLARNTKALNLTQGDLLELTTAVNQSLQIAGATSREAAAGVIQFSQGLASGRLSGDEFRSVVENMPRLAQAIADGLGVSISSLRTLSRQGELTAKKVSGAIATQQEKIADEYAKLPKRVEQSVTQLQNTLLASAGDIDTSAITEAIEDITRAVSSKEFKEGLTAFSNFTGETIKYLVDNSGGLIKLFAAWKGVKVGASLGRFAGPQGAVVGGLSGGVAAFLGADALLGDTFTGLEGRIEKQQEKVAQLQSQLNSLRLDNTAPDRFIERRQKALDAEAAKLRVLISEYASLNKVQASVGFDNQSNTTPEAANREAQGALVKDKGRVEAEIDKLLSRLVKQDEAFGKSKEEALIYSLTIGSLADNIKLLNTEIEKGGTKRIVTDGEGNALRNQIIARAESIRLKKLDASLDKEAASILNSLLTPLEEYRKKVDRLNVLLSAGKLTQEQYNKAVTDYKKAIQVVNPLVKEAQQVFDDTRTSTEKAGQEIKKLNELLNAGAFDNLGGIETYNRAVDKVKEGLEDVKDETSEFAKEAARNIQDGFAEFLFDPFSDGLDGMLLGFVETLRRMASEAIAAQASIKLLGKDFDETGEVGGILGGYLKDFGFGSEDKPTDSIGGVDILTGKQTGGADDGSQAIVDAVTSSGNINAAKTITQSAADALVGSTATNLNALSVQGAIAAQTTALVAAGTANTSAMVAALSGSSLGSASSSLAGNGAAGIGGAISNFLPKFHTGGISPKEQLAVLLKNEEVLTTGDPRHSKNNQSSAPSESSGTRIINVIDPSMVKDYMSSSSGEKVIMNMIQRNAGQVKQVLR